MGLLSSKVQQNMEQVQAKKEEPQPDKPMFMPPMSPPPLPEQDFFKYRVETTDIIEEIKHQLKGEILIQDNESGKSYWEQAFDRWVNDEGINKILHIIYSNGLNKNIFLGNLTHDEIMFKMKSLKKKLALLIFQKYQDFEIKIEMRSLIVSTIVNQVHSGLSRCEGGKEADQLSTATTRLESYSHQEKGKDSGITSHIPFMGKKQ